MVAIAYNIVHADDPSRDVRRRIGPPGEPWEAFVLNGRGRVFQTHSAGPFSLKWMAVGRARYDVDRRARTVSRDSAILLDQDQPYEMEFDSRRECESFCVFYAPALVAQAWASVEVGFGESPDPIGPRAFPNVSFTPSPRLANLLGSVRSSGVDCDPLQLESRLLLVLEEVIALAHHHRGLVGKIPAAKPATRAHLLGLVERARNVLVECRGVGWSLEALAAEVGLSKFHLLRLFRASFGVTPIVYAESVRMRAAAMRLRACDLSVGEIAAEFDYDSASAFARAFRRWSGAAPAAWRKHERGSEHLSQQAFRISKGQKVL
jgi:AraC-like DNA-binding protein